MALTGRQKAAMLLMSLDAATAAELVKGLDAEVVQELAVELAHLDAAGFRSSKQSAEVVQQFCNSLQTKETFHLNSFLNEMLRSTVGDEKAGQIQTQIQDLLHKRDPFMSIRSIDTQTIASVLEGEHPQAAAVVLSELPDRKSSEVIGLLGEGIRLSAISRMTGCETVTVEAKVRIAETVCRHLEVVTTSGTGEALAVRPEESPRKVAIILRNLGKEVRDGLLGAIQGKDDKTGEMVANLMIVWEDIPQVADRSLQEALRGVDAKKLALAFHKADEVITEKIRSNISERAVAAVDEEASLMSAPKKEDIEGAREEIVRVLHQMNEKGELAFIEECNA
jgi:flagellar motor switch protein FliG